MEVFLLDYELGLIDFDAAQERKAELPKLEGPTAKRVATAMTNLEVADHLTPRPRGVEAVHEVGEAFHKMAKAGRVPTKPDLLRGFWTYMFAWAEGARDVAAAKMIVGEVKKLAENDAQWKRTADRLAKQLAAMEGKK